MQYPLNCHLLFLWIWYICQSAGIVPSLVGTFGFYPFSIIKNNSKSLKKEQGNTVWSKCRCKQTLTNATSVITCQMITWLAEYFSTMVWLYILIHIMYSATEIDWNQLKWCLTFQNISTNISYNFIAQTVVNSSR